MDWTPINSQADLDKALAKGEGWLDLKVALRFSIIAGKNWRIRASAELRENAFARVFSAKKIRAVASAIVLLRGVCNDIVGGNQIKAVKPSTPAEWCEFYGVVVTDGVALLFKGG